jgi:hypothetical protein
MACDQVALGQTFRIGLSQPVSSYSSKPGMPVRGLLIKSHQWEGPPAFPTDTVIDGHIASVHKVGIGFRHEIATLGIESIESYLTMGHPLEMRTQVLEVDNAREKVRDGLIYGIRSTNTPQDHLSSRAAYF